jgi:hypothetical protein
VIVLGHHVGLDSDQVAAAGIAPDRETLLQEEIGARLLYRAVAHAVVVDTESATWTTKIGTAII